MLSIPFIYFPRCAIYTYAYRVPSLATIHVINIEFSVQPNSLSLIDCTLLSIVKFTKIMCKSRHNKPNCIYIQLVQTYTNRTVQHIAFLFLVSLAFNNVRIIHARNPSHNAKSHSRMSRIHFVPEMPIRTHLYGATIIHP